MRGCQHRFTLFPFTSCMHTYLLSALMEFNQASHGGLSVLDTWVCSWRSRALKWEATFFGFQGNAGTRMRSWNGIHTDIPCMAMVNTVANWIMNQSINLYTIFYIGTFFCDVRM